MTKIEAIIQPLKLKAVKEALIDSGIRDITVSQVHGHADQDGPVGIFRGHEYRMDVLPCAKIEMVVMDNQVDRAVDAIANSAAAGTTNDGDIFLSHVDDIIHIGKQKVASRVI